MSGKYLLLAILIALTASFSEAQNLTLGVKGGGSLVKMNFEGPVPEYRTNHGFSFGASVAYEFNELISLESDLLYVQKGTKYAQEYASLPGYQPTVYKYTYTLKYISIPFLAKLYLPVESDLQPHLTLGPSFNFLLGGKMEYTVDRDPNLNYPFIVIPSYFDITSKTKSFDLGVIAGLGVDYHLVSSVTSLEIRYEMGMTDIDKGIGSGPIKNRSFSILLGYQFQF